MTPVTRDQGDTARALLTPHPVRLVPIVSRWPRVAAASPFPATGTRRCHPQHYCWQWSVYTSPLMAIQLQLLLPCSLVLPTLNFMYLVYVLEAPYPSLRYIIERLCYAELELFPPSRLVSLDLLLDLLHCLHLKCCLGRGAENREVTVPKGRVRGGLVQTARLHLPHSPT